MFKAEFFIFATGGVLPVHAARRGSFFEFLADLGHGCVIKTYFSCLLKENPGCFPKEKQAVRPRTLTIKRLDSVGSSLTLTPSK